MGLDMYLRKSIYIAAQYEHRKVKANVKITVDGKPVKVDESKIYVIIESVGYWRKANAIHAWFVKNVQDGADDCKEYSVSFEQLTELKDLCSKVLKNKNHANLLPTKDGFSFGSIHIDENYMDDLEETVKIIEALDPEGEYIYESSW